MLEKVINGAEKTPRDFTTFKKSLDDISAISLNEYDRRWKKVSKGERKTSEEIDEILLKDNEEELRELSRLYWNISGLYRRLIEYMATMLTYDVLIIPKMNSTKTPDKNKLLNTLTEASYFIDNLDIEQELPRIFTTMLVDGVYYGFFKECDNGRTIFQDLSPDYCRTRYKSANNLPVLEFDLTYFITIEGREATTKVDELALYPKYVVKAYEKYFKKVTKIDRKGKTVINSKKDLEQGRWLIIPDSLGVVFYYKDEELECIFPKKDAKQK